MNKKYWFISYLAVGFKNANRAYGSGVIDISPAEWAIDMEDTVNGPHIVLYAEEITEKLYDKAIEAGLEE